MEKASKRTRQVWVKKTNASEPLMRCRKQFMVSSKPRAVPALGTESGGSPDYRPDGGRHRGGVSLTQALVWNVGTCCLDVKGETQAGGPCECESTNARQRDGVASSSDEGLVMRLERRGNIVRLYRWVNPKGEELDG
jgi:hypothetical protein